MTSWDWHDPSPERIRREAWQRYAPRQPDQHDTFVQMLMNVAMMFFPKVGP